MDFLIWAPVAVAVVFGLPFVFRNVFRPSFKNRSVNPRRRNHRWKQTATGTAFHKTGREPAKTEQKLRGYLQLLDTLINTIPNPIFYKNRDGVFMGCNRTFADKILGLSRSRIIGFHLDEFAGEIASDLENALRGSEKNSENGLDGEHSSDATITCADGVKRDFLFNSAPVTASDGAADGTVFVMFDLTEKNRAVQDRMEKEKFRGVLEIAGAVCHEFNQPLQALSGYAEMAMADSSETGLSVELAEKISVQVDRMADLTGKLQKITHYESIPYTKELNIFDIHGAALESDGSKKRHKV